MIDAKRQFQKNKPLSEQWSAVAHADWFAEVLMAARAQFVESPCTPDELSGMRRFEEILLTLSDVESTKVVYPTPGLKHDRKEDNDPNLTKKAK